MHKIRISYPDKYIILFDDDDSGAFRHVKIHPKVVVSHDHYGGQTLCMPVGSVFGSNVSQYN